VVCEVIEHRRRSGPALERDGQEARRLVDNDDGVVLVDNPHVPGMSGPGCPPRRASRAIAPEADDITGREGPARKGQIRLTAVEEHLPALDRD
jgi:hypothetical protein